MSDIAHSERAHARLSASGANRWINCPASVRVEDLFPDEEESEAAREGTLAHELAELEQRKYLNQISIYDYNVKLAEIRENVLYNPGMDDYVEEYVDYVLGYYNQAVTDGLNPSILIETRLDLTKYIPDGFGTSDNGILIDDTLHVFDLKFGYLRVDSQDNNQLKIYAIGMVEYFKAQNIFAKKNFEKTVKKVVMHIVQPRIKNISSNEMSIVDLQKWADSELVEFAKRAYNGEGGQKSGDHCQYCRGAHTCKVLADDVVETLEEIGDSDLELLSMEDKARLFLNLPLYALWVSALETHMTNVASSGVKFKGLKVVEGVSRRVITDESKVLDKLISEGYDEELLINRKLLNLSQLEKFLGKKEAAKTIGNFIFKPRGKMILAAESDKRKAYDLGTPESDFAEEIED